MTLTEPPNSVGPLEFDSPEGLHEALSTGEIPIAVYGLGKAGLPMAAHYADRTGNVIGVDIDPTVVETVNGGDVPFEHEPGLAALIDQTISSGSFEATDEVEAAATAARIHVVIVPVAVRPPDEDAASPSWTPEGRVSDRTGSPNADLRALFQAVEAIGGGLDAGDLVVIESTVPPGTTTEAVTPMLEHLSGRDRDSFGVAFSPERIQSGRALIDLKGAYPKVVGGIDASSTEFGDWVYRTLTDAEVVTVSDATTAECVKLLEGVYRDVNIALANELAQTTDDLGIDVLEAIAAANTQPYCDIHEPGAGVGGHCIPVYPHLLREGITMETPLIATARNINDTMPRFVARRTIDMLEGDGTNVGDATIAVLGVTYRPEIPETSNSPSETIIEHLQSAGASVVAVDPYIDQTTIFNSHRIDLDQLATVDPDAIILVTAHNAFEQLHWEEYDGFVVDCRDMLDSSAGRRYTVGRGSS